jgi:hypothetical protein
MKSQELRKLKAGTARAARLVCGLLGLALVALGPVRAQESGTTNGLSGPVATAHLDCQEVSFSFTSWGASLGSKAPVFKKEPALSGSKLIRGTLQLGASRNEDMGFVWDRAAGKLYLDLNRNLDLTDDPVAVCPVSAYSADNYQHFTGIRLPIKTLMGTRQTLVDISLYNYGTLNCSIEMRSFWQGKVTLQGQDWQVGLLGTPEEQRSSLESGHLLLRPWSERSKPFSVNSGSLEAFPFSRKLFFGNRAYQLQCTNEIQGGAVKARLQFTEQKPSLGELKITGQFVQRATLAGRDYLVVLDQPAATVKVPVGRYREAKVYLHKAGADAYLDGRFQAGARQITVNEKQPALLTVGGPLTNSVSLNRRGKNLALNYQLVGAGGSYQLMNQDRSHPPEFTIYLGDKKVKSGKFEFG